MRSPNRIHLLSLLLIFASLACGFDLGTGGIPPAEATLSALQTLAAQTELKNTYQQQIDSAYATADAAMLTANAPRTFYNSPQILLQRLEVVFVGLDGHKVIGSGCPGSDRKGTVENYHLLVSGVDAARTVRRILVAGDNSTLTWERPCNNNWALAANDLGKGNWEIFIAPSEPSQIYTVMIFYDDNTIALGMGFGQ